MRQEPLAYDLETETEGSLSEEKIAEYQQTERKLQQIESFYYQKGKIRHEFNTICNEMIKKFNGKSQQD